MSRGHTHIQPNAFDLVAGRAFTPTPSFEEMCVREEAERQRSMGRFEEWCAECRYPPEMFAVAGALAEARTA